MKRVALAYLIVFVALFLWGCRTSDPAKEVQLKARVDEYHNMLLSINDGQKAAENVYVTSLVKYLDPADRQDATYKAVYMQNAWLERNLGAKKRQQQNDITIQGISIGSDGRSALVEVTVLRRGAVFKRAEKWIWVNDNWYRTLEFTY